MEGSQILEKKIRIRLINKSKNCKYNQNFNVIHEGEKQPTAKDVDEGTRPQYLFKKPYLSVFTVARPSRIIEVHRNCFSAIFSAIMTPKWLLGK